MSDSNANPSDRGSAQRDKSNAPTSTTGQTGKSGRTASPADKNATYRQLLKDLRDDVRALGVTKSEALKEVEDTRRFTQELVEETQSFAQEMKSSMQGMREDMAALTKTVEDSTRNTKHVLEDMSDTLSRIEADIAQTRVQTKEALVHTQETRRELELFPKDMESKNSHMIEEVTAIIHEVVYQTTI